MTNKNTEFDNLLIKPNNSNQTTDNSNIMHHQNKNNKENPQLIKTENLSNDENKKQSNDKKIHKTRRSKKKNSEADNKNEQTNETIPSENSSNGENKKQSNDEKIRKTRRPRKKNSESDNKNEQTSETITPENLIHKPVHALIVDKITIYAYTFDLVVCFNYSNNWWFKILLCRNNQRFFLKINLFRADFEIYRQGIFQPDIQLIASKLHKWIARNRESICVDVELQFNEDQHNSKNRLNPNNLIENDIIKDFLSFDKELNGEASQLLNIFLGIASELEKKKVNIIYLDEEEQKNLKEILEASQRNLKRRDSDCEVSLHINKNQEFKTTITSCFNRIFTELTNFKLGVFDHVPDPTQVSIQKYWEQRAFEDPDNEYYASRALGLSEGFEDEFDRDDISEDFEDEFDRDDITEDFEDELDQDDDITEDFEDERDREDIRREAFKQLARALGSNEDFEDEFDQDDDITEDFEDELDRDYITEDFEDEFARHDIEESTESNKCGKSHVKKSSKKQPSSDEIKSSKQNPKNRKPKKNKANTQPKETVTFEKPTNSKKKK